MINLKRVLFVGIAGLIFGAYLALQKSVVSSMDLIQSMILGAVIWIIVWAVLDIIFGLLDSYRQKQSTTVYKFIIGLTTFIIWGHLFVSLLPADGQAVVMIIDMYLIPVLILLWIFGAAVESMYKPKTKTIYDGQGNIVSVEVIQ
jgi:hypothetical protein